jgi:hypothetical protein
VLKKLARALDEFATYINNNINNNNNNNAGAIVNYGERNRCGERISFVESEVNQVIAKRFVKKQQMRWTPRGAHLLLQARVQVLSDELRTTFQRWYPRSGAQAYQVLAASHPQEMGALLVDVASSADTEWVSRRQKVREIQNWSSRQHPG